MRFFLFFLLPILFFFNIITLHAQWGKTNGLQGGRVNSLVTWGQDTVLAGIGGDWVFSIDKGASWVEMPLPEGVAGEQIALEGKAVALRRYSNNGQNIFLSDDRGSTWNPLLMADTMLFYEFFFADGYFYGSDYHGLYRTNDQGAHWEYVVKKQISNIVFDGQRMTGYAYPYVVQSVDLGMTWDTLWHAAEGIDFMIQHENYLIGFSRGSGPKGCYASADYGKNWQYHPGTSFNQIHDALWRNGIFYAFLGYKILFSVDLGKTWETLPSSVNREFSTGVSVGTVMLASGYAATGVFKSTDGGQSWNASNKGLLSATTYSFPNLDKNLYSIGFGRLYALAPDQINWIKRPSNFKIPNGFPPNYEIQAGSIIEAGNNQIATIYLFGVQYSEDNGATWKDSDIPRDVSNTLGAIEMVRNRAIVKNYGESQEAVLVSDDYGRTFFILNTLDQQFNTPIASYCIDRNILYALGRNGHIYRSDDAGNQWHLIANSPFAPDTCYTAAAIRAAGGVLFVDGFSACKPGRVITVSKDNGLTWHVISGNSAFQRGVYQFLSIGPYIVAATGVGVLYTRDLGDHWSAWNEGFPKAFKIVRLAFWNGHLWAGVENGAIWKRPIAELGLQAVQGKVFWDKNLNGQFDADEAGIANVIVGSDTSPAYTNTQKDGTYTLLSALNEEKIRAYPAYNYFKVVPDTKTSTVPGSNVDFAFQLDPEVQDLSVALTSSAVFVPGFEAQTVLSWRNKIPIDVQNIAVHFNYSEKQLELLSASELPSMQTTGHLQWNYSEKPALAVENIKLKVRLSEAVQAGDSICIEASIFPTAGDSNPSDNMAQRCQLAMSSFDPNDKISEPETAISTSQIAAGQPICYTIRFQNTGNYPTAFIRIADTIQSNFDLSSFQYVAASHPCTWKIFPDRKIEFYLNEVALPPASEDVSGSQGFVKYTIKPLRAAPVGTSLLNTAHIFFDYNTPITTNTTKTIIRQKSPVSTDDTSALILTPNPSDHEVTAWTSGKIGTLIVQNAAGRLMLSTKTAADDPDFQFSVQDWPSGHYVAIFNSENKVQYGKLIVKN